MSDIAIKDRTKQIAFLNDALRKTCFGGTIVVTRGVQRFGPQVLEKAVEMVRTFDSFTEANDPYRERDFGSFELAGEVLFWRIDYYDQNLEFASPDPADAKQTRRVLTIMLASEY